MSKSPIFYRAWITNGLTLIAPVLLFLTGRHWLGAIAATLWACQLMTWLMMRSLARESDEHYDDSEPLTELDRLTGFSHERRRQLARESAVPNRLALVNFIFTVGTFVFLAVAIYVLLRRS